MTLLAEAGASGCSIEDYDPATDSIDDADARRRARGRGGRCGAPADEPMVLTARAENHLHGVDDLDDTIARLSRTATPARTWCTRPGLRDPSQIARLVDAVGVPVNVLALPGAPSVPELESLGVRRVSTGSLLAAPPTARWSPAPASCTGTARPRTRAAD